MVVYLIRYLVLQHPLFLSFDHYDITVDRTFSALDQEMRNKAMMKYYEAMMSSSTEEGPHRLRAVKP